MDLSLEALDVVFSTMDQRIESAEAHLSQYTEENAAKTTEFQDDVSKCVNSLTDEISNLLQKCDVVKCNLERKKDLEALYEEELKRKDNQMCELEVTQEVIARKETQLAAEKEELAAKKKTIYDELETMKTNLKSYKQYLGLDIRKTSKNGLGFVFVNINRDDPEEEYFFQISLDESESYIVDNCTPKLKGFDAMVDRLNRDNDLGRFVCEVRKGFCAYAKKCSSKSEDDVKKENI